MHPEGAAIDVVTLGRFAVFAGGEALGGITSQPVRASLLVYLAVEREATRDAVLACLWPEHEPALARHALSQTLYQLRQDLGNEWIDARGTYLEAGPGLSVDALRFAEAIEGERYEDAIAAYHGPFLEGCHLAAVSAFQHWVDRHRSRLARLHRKARRQHIEHLVPSANPEGALHVARDWVELEPLDDEAQQHLIRLLADTGGRAEALRHYEDFSRLLAFEELEVGPSGASPGDNSWHSWFF